MIIDSEGVKWDFSSCSYYIQEYVICKNGNKLINFPVLVSFRDKYSFEELYHNHSLQKYISSKVNEKKRIQRNKIYYDNISEKYFVQIFCRKKQGILSFFLEVNVKFY